VRSEIVRLLKAAPFRPFLIIRDSGQRIVVRHSENVAFDPAVKTVNRCVLSDGILHVLPWEKASDCFGTTSI